MLMMVQFLAKLLHSKTLALIKEYAMVGDAYSIKRESWKYALKSLILCAHSVTSNVL